MQECFKQYPEIYDPELAGEDGDVESVPTENADVNAEPSTTTASSSRAEESTTAETTAPIDTQPQADSQSSQVPNSIETDQTSNASGAEVKTE